MNFIAGRLEAVGEFGVGARYMPAAVDEDDCGLNSGHSRDI